MNDRGIGQLLASLDAATVGAEMHRLVCELYPICRSITGDGLRATLRALAQRIPLELLEVPTGTRVFDWTVPREWNIRNAWIKDPSGRKIVDFRQHNLHVVGYSVPVRETLTRAELEPHLHSLPDRPEWIPYRTSYYQESWGFCLPHRQRQALGDGEYEVLIDSTLSDGSLTFGELLLPGESEEEVLVSCHSCHPSLCNDNLSGMVVSTFLAEALRAIGRRRFSYRFLFIPGTIGAITWLALNEGQVSRIRHGLVAANLGDGGPFTYKQSRRGDADIDRAVAQVLAASGEEHSIERFVPFGYDERQYCSPGFDLPVGSLTRTPWGRYPEYHTSADNPDFVRPRHLAESLRRYLGVFEVLERDQRYRNTNPRCEPQLGRRGLYRSLGGGDEGRERELALLWVLNLSDGERSLLDIAERSGMPFATIADAADSLLETDLLRQV